MPTTSRRLADLIRTLGIDHIVPVLENTGPGNTVEIDKDDFKPEVLSKMTGYTAAVTIETQNEFPLTTVQGKFGLSDSSGNPAGIRDPGENDQVHFSQRFQPPSPDGRSAKVELENTSNSGLLDVDSARGGKFIIKKGKTSIVGPTGTDIYKEVNELGEQSNFVKRVRQVQFENNRFTLGKTYIPRSGLDLADGVAIQTEGSSGASSVSEDESNIGVGFAQVDFGKHVPRKFPTSQVDNAVLVKLKDLKKIGLLTMLQASGEYYIPQDPDDVAQQVAARGAALAPGLARMGQKIDIARVSPVKIMKDINPDFTKPNLDDNIKREPILSYGNVNNWMAPFAGLSSTASVASAALLALTIGGLIKGAAGIIIAARRPSNPVHTGNMSNSDRRRRLGSYLGKADEVSAFRNTDFDIQTTQTNHDYFQAVSKGVDIFFNIAAPGVTAVKIAQNHGYYNTILRSIIRSTTDFVLMAVGGVVNTADGDRARNVNDVTLLGNPLGPIELIHKLNESPLLKFCNILATIGDVALNHADAGFAIDLNGEVNEHISDVDRLAAEAGVGPDRETSLNPAVMHSINRLGSNFRNALAWGSNTTKSMYLIPNSIFQAEATFLNAQDQSRNPTENLLNDLQTNNLHKVKGPDGLDGNRISPADVKAMEEHLEAEYMPFYFHDIRTNEIISFHAFMESMADSFDPEYTEVEGYGRIGKALIYKNTQRSISLEFRVVATNEKDFDHMWYKINKLITLVYPQYTEGRQVGTSTDKFIQPFSQVPSASPLVRLRLGDVWKSNYTKFALARLFGVGSSQFALQGQQGNIRYNASLRRNLEQVTQRMGRDGEYNVEEYALLTPLPIQPGRGSGQRLVGYPRVSNVTDSPSQPGQTQRTGRGGAAGASQGGFTSVTGTDAAGGRSIVPIASPAGAPLVISQNLRVRITQASRANDNPDLKVYHFTVPGGTAGQDGVYGCTQHDLRPDPTEVARIAYNQSSPDESGNQTTNNNTQDPVTTFFNTTGDNGNPIVKAFESTKGKGLAGFIKALRFDWSDARWETGRHNARAPMSCKIAMEFAPIHDINPGLDSEGFMTAPVYNVGDTIKSWANGMPEDRAQAEREVTLMKSSLAAAQPRSSNGVGNGGGAGGAGGVGGR